MSIEGSYGWIRSEAESQLSAGAPYNVYVWIKDVFHDVVIAEYEMEHFDGGSYSTTTKIVSVPYTVSGSTLTLEGGSEVKLDYVATKRKEIAEEQASRRGPMLGGPIAVKDASKRLVTGAVLVPGETDAKGEPPLTPERIEEAAHEWMRDFRYSDRDHDFGSQVAVPVESYTLPEDMAVKMGGEDVVLPAGSWVVTSYVTDDVAWKDVTDGTLTGYSIAGIRRDALEAATKSGEDVAFKSSTRLADLGEDWVSGAVSLVGQPAVPKGTWFAIKSHTDSVRDREESREAVAGTYRQGGFWSRLFGVGAAEGEQATKSDEYGEDEDVAQVTQEDVKRIVEENVGGAVMSALKSAGVVKEEESDTDRILTALKDIGERVEKIESGSKTATKSAEGEANESDEGSESEMVQIPASEWREITEKVGVIAEKQKARTNGARRTAPKGDDTAVKSTRDDDPLDNRDSAGRSIKKVYS